MTSGSTTDFSPADLRPDEILRGEPFGAEHLEAHARALADWIAAQSERPADRHFQGRFEENARVLRAARERIAATSPEELAADAEWLLDNFHIVEEQLREIVDDLPPGFY